jgi:hypothetical protein
VWDLLTGGLLWSVKEGAPIFSVAWGVDWSLGRERMVACMMGLHKRLGAESSLNQFDEGVLHMVVDPQSV